MGEGGVGWRPVIAALMSVLAESAVREARMAAMGRPGRLRRPNWQARLARATGWWSEAGLAGVTGGEGSVQAPARSPRLQWLRPRAWATRLT